MDPARPPVATRPWSVVALVLATVTGPLLAFAPVMSTGSCEASSSGPSLCTTGHSSLVGQEGAGILLVFAVPIVITALAVVLGSRRATLTCAILLSGATVVGMLSVGLFFIPTMICAWVAVARYPTNAPRWAVTVGG